MHHKLVKQAFKKIKEIEVKKSGIPMSDTHASEELSTILTDEYNASISDRTLRDVYNGIKNIGKSKVVSALCKFLNYEDFNDFLINNKEEKTKVLIDFGSNSNLNNTRIQAGSNSTNLILEKAKVIIKKNKASAIVFTFILFAGITYFYASTKQRWMIWNEDHYEEVSFDTKKYELGKLKLYKKDRIKYFKKIEGTCEYQYFDKEGKPSIWYGKNDLGELELFTSVGLHPETGKTLKHITAHIIHKYICQ